MLLEDELADAQLYQKSALTLDICACKIPNARNCSFIEAPQALVADTVNQILEEIYKV